jgi:hypothetical protein
MAATTNGRPISQRPFVVVGRIGQCPPSVAASAIVSADFFAEVAAALT